MAVLGEDHRLLVVKVEVGFIEVFGLFHRNVEQFLFAWVVGAGASDCGWQRRQRRGRRVVAVA